MSGPVASHRTERKGESFHRRNVIVYSNELLPYSETFIYEQARSLNSWTPLLMGEKASAHSLPLAPLRHCVLEDHQVPQPLRSLYRRLRRIGFTDPRSTSITRSFQASLVHAHFGTAAVEIAPLARHLKLPMLVTLHGYDVTIKRDWWEHGNAGPRGKLYPERLLRLAAWRNVKFLAVSRSILEAAVKFGLPRDKIEVSYIGVDVDRFRPVSPPLESRARTILFVGRLVEKKGASYLIQAFPAIKEKNPDSELVFAGDGPLRAELEQMAREMSVPAKFLGACTSEQVRHLMGTSRILCLPSVSASNGDSEGLPIAILEAQACGLPVVTSAAGGRDEGIENGVTGYSFPEGDVPALADRLNELLRNDEILSACGSAARNRAVEIFNLKDCTRALEYQYDAVCEFSQ